MAAGAFTWFNKAIGKVGTGLIDLDSHTFKCVLTTSLQALAATFVGASTNCLYADLTNELPTAAGYTVGGATLGSVTWTQSTAVWKFDAADASWAAITATFKYAVIYDDTAAGDPLLGFVDLNTGGGNVDFTGGTGTLQWNVAGIYTQTRV